MIENSARALCAMSLLCGAAMSISPEGSVKKIMSVLCAAALIMSVLMPLKSFDYASYALELAKLQEREQDLQTNGEEINSRLNRLVIQSEYQAYIMDKAEKLGLKAERVKVGVEWSTEGLWVPASAEIDCSGEEKLKKSLSEIISSELGIPPEKQYWSENE